MSHKTYRICLLMVAIAATVGGILYYCLCVKDEKLEEKGTLVKQMQQTGERMKEAGKSVKDDVVQAFSKTGKEIKGTAQQVGHNMKDAAQQAGHGMKDAAQQAGHEMKDAAQQMGHDWKETAQQVGQEMKGTAADVKDTFAGSSFDWDQYENKGDA